jgi:HD-GYP domain-containing protein (c-di-GMP phosphodiesterase class II)
MLSGALLPQEFCKTVDGTMHNPKQFMRLVPVSVESIRIGQPLPFPLMDKAGMLLARKNFVVETQKQLVDIAQRSGGLYIDVADSEIHHRAYVGQLHELVRGGKPLGEIAGTKLSVNAGARTAEENDKPDWLDLQEQGKSLLRDSNPVLFMERLERLQAQLNRHSTRNPDGTLFALIHLSATEVRWYSATHAMLVSVMCGLAAREVLGWNPGQEAQVCKAALTMNLGMSELQDRLASQVEPPSAAQRQVIDAHAAKSADMLASLGVTDEDWLGAVRDHHTNQPGSLRSRPVPGQMARLIQRADMFAARLAPRAARVPLPPAAAMQACYFDEGRNVDEAGAAMIKAVGIYQPGSFVRLATDEIAVVVRRGLNTTTPRVAVLVNRSGLPTGEPLIRETSFREHRVVSSVAHRDVKVKLNLERMLPFTAASPSDRPW